MSAFIPHGSLAVLNHVAAGRSAWHGWDASHPANTTEGQDAYGARRALRIASAAC